MALQTLPAELLLLIAESIPDHSVSDLSALARSSQHLHTLLNPHLYRRAIRLHREASSSALERVFLLHNQRSLQLFFAHGLSVHTKLRRLPLLAVAIEQQSYALTQLLLVEGADANEPDWRGATPLTLAVRLPNRDIVRLLLSSGADVDKPNAAGVRPLYDAVVSGDRELIRLLLEKGADVDAPVTRCVEDVPLRLACRCYQGKVMAFLMKAGASVETCLTGAEEMYLRTYIS
ncbi:ankyrin repeat-containing domain protein [Sphaerosporella brunnea]|uniref:Ankyrin repeat-containing domain protein n=1 Tax=Sphaerosporella brunnea TaxID=1250544 RepID=A0A5J5FB07_9PEZI|nr:ankyrin repeat-containing domain protein [Sphaerosporella brunnea]